MQLRTHPEANKDFQASYIYYETESAGLGEKFYNEIKDAYKYIKEFPLRNSIIKGSYRRISLKKFPFEIVYTYSKTLNRISISSIHHTSKHPQKRFRKF